MTQRWQNENHEYNVGAPLLREMVDECEQSTNNSDLLKTYLDQFSVNIWMH